MINTESGNIESQEKIDGNLKSFKQGYILTDAGVLYRGEFDFHSDENQIVISREFKLERISKIEEKPIGISVIVYKKSDQVFFDETAIFMQMEDNTISQPFNEYLGENDILNNALFIEKNRNASKEIY